MNKNINDVSEKAMIAGVSKGVQTWLNDYLEEAFIKAVEDSVALWLERNEDRVVQAVRDATQETVHRSIQRQADSYVLDAIGRVFA